MVKSPPANVGDVRDAGLIPGSGGCPGGGHGNQGSSAWRIPLTEEPGGLQTTGSRRVRHDWRDLTYTPINMKPAYEILRKAQWLAALFIRGWFYRLGWKSSIRHLRVCVLQLRAIKSASVSSKQRWRHQQCLFRGLFKEPSREIQSGWAGSTEQGTSLLGSEVRPPGEGPLWDKLFWLKQMHKIPPPPHRPVRCLPHGSLSHGKVFQLFYWHFQTSPYWTVYFFKSWGFGFKKKCLFLSDAAHVHAQALPRGGLPHGGSEGAAALSARRCPGPGALGRRPLSPWELGPPEQRLRPGICRPPRGADRLQNVAIKWELPRLQGDINCH